MKSSSISLLYVPGAGGTLAGTSDEDKADRGYLVNLIDSPGHVDFCSEARTQSPGVRRMVCVMRVQVVRDRVWDLLGLGSGFPGFGLMHGVRSSPTCCAARCHVKLFSTTSGSAENLQQPHPLPMT